MAKSMSSTAEVSIPLITIGSTPEDADSADVDSHANNAERTSLSKRNASKTRQAEGKPHIPINRSLTTRNACIAALAISWVAALVCTICGAAMLTGANPYGLTCGAIRNDSTVAEVARLATISVTTLLVESAGFVHAASLRWSLLREGRLQYNSNLRLFSFSRLVRANQWYTNFFMALCTIVAYASASLLVLSAEVQTGSNTEDLKTVGWSTCATGLPTLLLGLNLLVVAVIGTWSLSVPNIMTWRSSPLDVALAIAHLDQTQRHPGRCMLSIEDLHHPTAPARPRLKQCSATKARNNVKYLLCVLGALEIICCAWIGGVYGLINSQGWGGWQWTFFPKEGSTFNMSPGMGGDQQRVMKVFALYTALQAPVTLGLHCAELVVNMSRDEMYWRRATTDKGCDMKSYDSVVAAFTSWQSVLLYTFKALLHWMFGIAVSPYVSAAVGRSWQGNDGSNLDVTSFSLHLGLPQAVWFTILFGFFSAIVVWIALSRPTGPQPSTYGHVQTLIDLIDVWSVRMYWGHKELPEGSAVQHAGTSDTPLPPVDVDALYS